ncbi:MAG: hypothetical protein R3249_06810 [Nitriliruptorales bacterium]|nr:hypothetical protein [Nitriliruptorales bacterium]
MTSSAGRDGGGIHNLGQLTIINDPNELAGDISFNTAGRDGGGVYHGGATTLSVTGTRFNDNQAGQNGGGVHHVGSQLTATDVEFFNTAAGTTLVGQGGGVHAAADATFTGARFDVNEAQGPTGQGGALYVFDATVTVDNGSFQNNVAGPDDAPGGGAPAGGAIAADGPSSPNFGELHLHNTELIGNSVDDGGFGDVTAGGGGIFVGQWGNVTVERTRLEGNSAVTGGGIWDQGGLSVLNSTLHANTATDTGGAIHYAGNGPLQLAFNTIATNSAGSSGGGIELNTNVSTTIARATLLMGNVPDDCAGPYTIHSFGWLKYGNATCTINPTDNTNQVNGATTATTQQLPGVLADYATYNAGTGVYDPIASPVLNDINSAGCADLFNLSYNWFAGPGVQVDQLGAARPMSVGCDVGARESQSVPPSVTASLTRSNPGSTAPGATIVPANEIRTQLGNDSGIQSTGIDRAELFEAPLANIPLANIPLANIPLANIPLANISFDLDALQEVFEKIMLSELVLQPDANGNVITWEQLLAGSDLEGRPVQSITLAQALADPVVGGNVAALPLANIDFRSTPLANIPLFTLPLANIPAGEFPWAQIFGVGGGDLDVFCQWLDNSNSDVTCADYGLVPPYPPLSEQPSIFDLAIGGAPLANIPLANIFLQGAPLANIPLANIPLANIELSGTPLANIPLANIPLANIHLETEPDGTPLPQSTPLANIPLANIPLANIPLANIPLGNIPLANIPLANIPLANIPLANIPLANIAGSFNDGSGVVHAPLANIPLANIPLANIPLANIPLANIPLANIGPNGTPLANIPLANIPLANIDILGSPLANIPLANIPLANILIPECQTTAYCDQASGNTLGDAFAASKLAQDASVAHLLNVGTDGQGNPVTLKDLLEAALGSTSALVQDSINDTTLADLIDPNNPHNWAGASLRDAVDFSPLTLAELAAILPTDPSDPNYVQAHAAEFEALMDNAELGMLLGFGEMTLGDVLHLLGAAFFDIVVRAIIEGDPPAVDGGMSLIDLLLTILPPDQFPWQELDVASGGIQLAAGTTTYNVSFDVFGQASAQPVIVTLTLPPSAVFAGAAIAPTNVNGNVITWELVVPDGTTTFDVQIGESLAIGPTATSLDVNYQAAGLQASDQINYTVAEELEPNDKPSDPGVADLEDGLVYVSHVGAAGDIDLYAKFLEEGEGFSVHLGGIPDEADFDLVIYGPVGTDQNGFFQQSVEDDSTSTQQANDVPLLPDRPALKISAQRDNASERVDLQAVRASGIYLVQVSGYNESFKNEPYTLRSQTFGAPKLPPCTDRAFPHAGLTVAPQAPTGLDANTRTLFLFARERFARLHGAAALTDVEQALAPVAAMNGSGNDAPVNGAIVDLGYYPAVVNAFTAWDDASGRCDVETANVLAEEIRQVVLGLRANHPNVSSVVIIGADEVMPFMRVPDLTEIANERTYAGALNGENNELISALAHGWYLTDNAFVDSVADNVGGRPVWVPEIAVGRLVEEPGDIVTQLNHFAQFDGRLDPTTTRTTAVTGYEFLTDGANAVADELDADQANATDRSLISDTWTSDDLRALLSDGSSWDIASPNAHFDHHRGLSAAESVAGTQADLFDTTDIAGGYAGVLTMTMGCHSGFSVSNVSIGQGVRTDWAETFGGFGGTFVGTTGYGYGETETVALNELLLAQLADRLDGTMTIGEALAFAKAEYAADLSAYGVYDEKVVMQTTFYGLPMYLIGDADFVPPVAPPVNLTTDAKTGLKVRTNLDFNAAATPFVQRFGGNGDWWEVTDPTGGTFGPQVTANQPIQPRWEVDATAHDGNGGIKAETRGVVIEGLTNGSTGPLDPAIATPVVDQAETQPEPDLEGLAFPTTFARVTNYETPAGSASNLVFVPGQFRGSSDSGQQLLFDGADLTVYYGAPGTTDLDPPQIHLAKTTVDPADNVTTVFEVKAVDHDSSVARLRVVYREPGEATWVGIDLIRVAGPDADGVETFRRQVTLANPLPAGSDVEFLAQAVDTVGWVGVSTAKAIFHTSDEDDGSGGGGGPAQETPGVPEVTGGAPLVNGWYTGSVTVEVVGDNDGDAKLYVDGNLATTSTAVVSGAHEGHVVTVMDEGVFNTIYVPIDDVAPDLTINEPVDGAVYQRGAFVMGSVTATDDHSGVDNVAYPAVIETIDLGENTFEATATDVAGNQSTASTTYRVVDLDHADQALPDEVVQVTVLGAEAGTAVIDFGDGTTAPADTPVTVDGEPGYAAFHAWSDPGTYSIKATVGGTLVLGGEIRIFDPLDRIDGQGLFVSSVLGILDGQPNFILPKVTVDDAHYLFDGTPVGAIQIDDLLANIHFSMEQISYLNVKGNQAQIVGKTKWSQVTGNVNVLVNIKQGSFLVPDKVRVRVWKGNETFYDTHPGEPNEANIGKAVLLGGYDTDSTD